MTDIIYGTRLNYNTEGDGGNILFLHGWGGSMDSFKAAADFFKKKNRIINLDFPPFGESGAPDRVWGITDYVNLVLDFLKKQDIKKVSVVAHSFGGRVAIYLAANYPELIDKLVLVDSAGIIPRRTLKYYKKVRQYKRAKKMGLDLSGYGSADYRNLPDGMRETFTRIVNEDLSGYLGRISSETLIVWGRSDTDTPLYMAKKIKRKIKNSALVLLDGGHYAYAERYPQFIGILDAFIGA